MIKILPMTAHQTFQAQLSRLYPDDDKKVKEITFQVTDDCCMKCSYCYQKHKQHHKLSFETAKKFIDKLLDTENPLSYLNPYSNTMGIVLDFIGGEPLMEVDLITQICDYLTNEMIKKNHPWLYKHRFSICSNGLLYFTPAVQKFLQKYHNRLSFTVSIDGNKELHDSCRVDLQGNGTYDRALAAMQHYATVYHGSLNTKMTLSPENIQYTSDAIINLINLKYDTIFANCVFEPGWTVQHAQTFYQELKKISNFICTSDLDHTVLLSLLDKRAFLPRYSDDNWCGGVGENMLALDYLGNYYPCLRYMESSLNGEQEPLIIGAIDTGFYTTEKQLKIKETLNSVTKTSQSTKECLECPIESGCAWCSGYNYQCYGTVNKRATNICLMHKARALGNWYFWKHYEKNTDFQNFLPKEQALQIISLKEWEELSIDE